MNTGNVGGKLAQQCGARDGEQTVAIFNKAKWYLEGLVSKGFLTHMLVYIMSNCDRLIFEYPEILDKFWSDEIITTDYIDYAQNVNPDIQNLKDMYVSHYKYSRGGIQTISVSDNDSCVMFDMNSELTVQDVYHIIKDRATMFASTENIYKVIAIMNGAVSPTSDVKKIVEYAVTSSLQLYIASDNQITQHAYTGNASDGLGFFPQYNIILPKNLESGVWLGNLISVVR